MRYRGILAQSDRPLWHGKLFLLAKFRTFHLDFSTGIYFVMDPSLISVDVMVWHIMTEYPVYTGTSSVNSEKYF